VNLPQQLRLLLRPAATSPEPLPPEFEGADPDLTVAFDELLPMVIPTGAGATYFIAGSCTHAQQPVVGLDLVVNRIAQPVDRYGVWRIEQDDPERPNVRHYTGFWTLLDIPGGDTALLQARAALADGSFAFAELGHFHTSGFPVPGYEPVPARRSRIAIALPTFEPDPVRFLAQIESIRSQTADDWTCVIGDDGSNVASFEQICATVGDDDRFVVVRNPQRLGFYRNFERTLALLPPSELVALADQDDVWHAEKLERLAKSVATGPLLAYSDCRVVDGEGDLVSPTFYRGRRNNWTDLYSLVVSNTVPSAAMLFRRELLDAAMPFPPLVGPQFHDHWIAATALARGEIGFVDEPLYDYVQHGANAVGWGVEPDTSTQGLLQWIDGAIDDFSAAPEWFFLDTLRVRQMARTLLLRGGGHGDAGKHDALEVLADLVPGSRAPAHLATLARNRRDRKGVTLDHERRILWGLARATVDRARAATGLRPASWDHEPYGSSRALRNATRALEPGPGTLPTYPRNRPLDAIDASGAAVYPSGLYVADHRRASDD
jgi:hypothetical protein